MGLLVTQLGQEANDLTEVGTAGTAVLGRIAIPGRGEHVRVARAFVGHVLAGLCVAGRPPDTARHLVSGAARLDAGTLETAVLLTSELVTNAVRHSRSGRPGGAVSVVVLAVTGGIRIEVTDGGSAGDTPVVKDDVYTCDGHGLFLVEALADRWGYECGASGTTVWFGLRSG
jgi:anti-sigma regulatory factor (Ser/Thr protein kinase)